MNSGDSGLLFWYRDVMTATSARRRRFSTSRMFSQRRVDFGRTRRKSSSRIRRTSTTFPDSRRRRRSPWQPCDSESSGTETFSRTSERHRDGVVPHRAARATAIDIPRTTRRRLPVCREHAQRRPEHIRLCRSAGRRSRDHIRCREHGRRSRNCRRLELCVAQAARRLRSRVQTKTSSSQR